MAKQESFPVNDENSENSSNPQIFRNIERRKKGHFLFKIGESVSVRRSSGKIESDWYVQEYDGDAVIVGKTDENGKYILKRILEDELQKLNKNREKE